MRVNSTFDDGTSSVRTVQFGGSPTMNTSSDNTTVSGLNQLSWFSADNKVIVFVRDHGPGIVEEDRARIFEKFYRGKSERHLKGTGMGLAIVEEIIRAHGEDISVTSKPGEGSEFWFSLPIAQGSSAE